MSDIVKCFNKVYSLRNHIDLIKEFSKRDFLQRYKGSYLGFLWALVYPLVMLAVYSFIFIVVFKNKWGELPGETNATYTLMIFSGLVPFYIFSESVNRSLNILVCNANYIKKVVMPVEVLPISLVISTTMNQLFGLGLLVVGKLIFMDTPNWTLIFIPMLLIPLILLSLGCSLIFSAIGVYIRDLAHVVSLVINVLFYMSPIFYSSTKVPDSFKFVIKLNPLAPIIDMWRDVILKGQLFDVSIYVTYVITMVIFVICSFGVFYYFRKGFADVI